MEPEYIELNMRNYSEEQVSQLNAWAIWADAELERMRNERKAMIVRDCIMDEVEELMDCIDTDHTFEDLDKHTPADMQTTTGSTIAWLMHRCYAAEMEVQRFKDAKNPLFERGVCGRLLEACKLSLDACQKNLTMAEYKDEPALLNAFRACRLAIEKADHFRDAMEMVESK
jgi:hypothetical protein